MTISTLAFLRVVLGDGFSGWIETRAIPEPKKTEREFTKPFFWQTPEQAVAWLGRTGATMNATSHGIFFGAARRTRQPSEHWRGGRNEDVDLCSSLWADLDWKSYSGGKDEAAERLRECHPAPGVVVCSGGGFHAYWRLRQPLSAIVARHYNSRLALLLASDKAVVNPGRVMRLPGSLHRKNPENIRPVSIVGWMPDLRYSEQAFLSLPALPAFHVEQITTLPVLRSAGSARRYAESALRKVCEDLSMPSTEKHRRLLKAAIRIGHFVGAGMLGEAEASDWLLAAIRRAGAEDMRNAANTVRDGMKIGVKEPFNF